MHKIPMSETVSGAYNFAFKNFLSVLGIAWFPFAVFGAIVAVAVIGLMPSLSRLDSEPFDPSAIGGIVAVAFLIIAGLVIVASIVSVGVMRQALGLHKGPVFIYFTLGEAVWRMIGALLLVCLIVYGFAIVATAVIAWILVAGPAVLGKGVTTTIGVVAGVAAFLFYIYAFVRLIFFIAPVVVAEERIGLGRAWELGRGNFWRIVGVWIAVTLPVGIAFNMLFSVLLGTQPYAMMRPDMTPQEVFAMWSQLIVHLGPVLAVCYLIYVIVLTGLTTGAQATAYLAVTGKGAAPANPPIMPPDTATA